MGKVKLSAVHYSDGHWICQLWGRRHMLVRAAKSASNGSGKRTDGESHILTRSLKKKEETFEN